MKIKYILLGLVFTLFVTLFNGNVLASRDFTGCMELNMFCNYQGMRKDLEKADEEFNMLLEPIKNPNFQEMQVVIDRIIGCACSSEKHMDILKNSPNCNVTKYTQRLLKFYEVNKEKIIEHMRNADPDLEIVTMFNYFKEKVGNNFLQ